MNVSMQDERSKRKGHHCQGNADTIKTTTTTTMTTTTLRTAKMKNQSIQAIPEHQEKLYNHSVIQYHIQTQ